MIAVRWVRVLVGLVVLWVAVAVVWTVAEHVVGWALR